METMMTLLIILGCFIVVAIVFRRVLGAVFEDYFIDGLLSTLDTFIGGAVGFDIGDFIAAGIMLFKERKVVGLLPALIVAWEATNFFPAGLIPGVEIVTNLFPAATLTRLIANKYGSAQKAQEHLAEEEKLLEEYGDDSMKKPIRQVSALIDQGDPVDAIQLAEREEKTFREKLGPQIEQAIAEVENRINALSNTEFDAYPEAFEHLRSGIEQAKAVVAEARDALDSDDLSRALTLTQQAQRQLTAAAQEFDKMNTQ